MAKKFRSWEWSAELKVSAPQLMYWGRKIGTLKAVEMFAKKVNYKS